MKKLKVPTPLATISPIEQTAGLFINSMEEINEIIEPPLRESMRILFERGVRTVSSSANRLDLAPDRNPNIILDITTMNATNLRITSRKGYIDPYSGTSIIEFPATPETTIESISKQAVAFAQSLLPQPPIWIIVYKSFYLEELLRAYRLPLIAEYQSPRYWQRQGYIYDPELRLYFSNENLHSLILPHKDYFTKHPKDSLIQRRNRILESLKAVML